METIAGLATIPSRESTLRYVIDSILPQVDHLYVAFNDYSELPIWLTEYPQKLHFFLTGKDNMSDAEKFRLVEEFEDAIYCSIDDDLIYPPFYVKNLIRGIQVYNYRDWETDRKSTRLNSSHSAKSRMPSSA